MVYIIAIQFVLILSGLAYIAYLKLFKRYTRERFAFTSMTLMVSTVLVVIGQIYSSQGYISALLRTSHLVMDTKVSTYQTDWKDHLLTIFLMTLLANYLLKLYKHWDGPISVETKEKLRFNQPTPMMEEAYRQLVNIFSGKKLEAYVAAENIGNHNVFSSNDQNKLPWHVNVCELLTLSSDQYILDLDGYYPKESCFLGSYGHRLKLPVAVLCSTDYPKDSKIREFLAFAKKSHKDIYEYIIAVKNLTGKQEVFEYNGTQVIIRNEAEMLDSLINFESYFRVIGERFNESPVTEGGLHSLADIYVKLKGKNIAGEEVGFLENYILEWAVQQNEQKHIALLGEYGCGKSVLSLKVACEMIQQVQNGGRVPILIELRGKSPRTLSVSEILATWSQEYHISAAALMKLHKSGWLVLIFEGFDEMDMVGDRDMRQDHFQRLWEFATPKAKIIITGRPNFFWDDRELRENLGIEKISEELPYCEAMYLEKFDMPMIARAMRKIDPQTREQVLEILEQSGSGNFYDLVSRPAILYLVSVIWKERKLSQMRDKINSALIISEFIAYSYSRQTGKRAIFPLSEKEREYFMIGVAAAMVSKTEYTNQIHKNDLEHVVLTLYKHFPAEVSGMISVLEPKRKALNERMSDGKAEESILTDVRSCGILTNDLTRKDYFKFAHKSFLEYLVSLYFTETLLQDKGGYNIIANAVSKALGISMSTFPHSRQTVSFTSEILISKLNLDVSVGEEKVARKLFGILYPIKFFGKFPRLVVAVDLLLSQSVVLIFLITATGYMLALQVNGTIVREVNAMYLSAMSLSLLVMSSYFIVRVKVGRNNKISRIWANCCLELRMNRQVLEKIVSKNYLSFLLEKTNRSYFSFLVGNLIQKYVKIYYDNKTMRRLGKAAVKKRSGANV